jgi:hypothetical protein
MAVLGHDPCHKATVLQQGNARMGRKVKPDRANVGGSIGGGVDDAGHGTGAMADGGARDVGLEIALKPDGVAVQRTPGPAYFDPVGQRDLAQRLAHQAAPEDQRFDEKK